MKIAIFTLASLALAYLGVRLGGHCRNQGEVERARERLRAEAPSSGKIIRHADLRAAKLPPIVLRYLERALPDGMAVPRLAFVFQEGGFRLRAGAPFMAMRAEQLFSVQQPGLVWQATMRLAPGVPILVRDSLVAGRGEFGGRLFGLFRVASGTGPAVDQATLIRYLSEAVWLPQTLAPSDWLHWEAIDDRSARVVATYGGQRVSGIYTFDQSDRPIAFDAPRGRDVGGTAVLTPWHVVFDRHERRMGVEIPTVGTVSWMLPEGPLDYGHFLITSLSFTE